MCETQRQLELSREKKAIQLRQPISGQNNLQYVYQTFIARESAIRDCNKSGDNTAFSGDTRAGHSDKQLTSVKAYYN